MKKIAIFASGNGSNAVNLINQLGDDVVSLVVSSRQDAPVVKKVLQMGVDVVVWNKTFMADNEVQVLQTLKKYEVGLIVLAGYLLQIPDYLLEAYEDRIVNIHPSLLPRHGGKGMYGLNVHQSVLASRDQVSGITIHLVTKEYDSGEILYQATCPVYITDTPELLAERVHGLEYEFFPKVVKSLLN